MIKHGWLSGEYGHYRYLGSILDMAIKPRLIIRVILVKNKGLGRYLFFAPE